MLQIYFYFFCILCLFIYVSSRLLTAFHGFSFPCSTKLVMITLELAKCFRLFSRLQILILIWSQIEFSFHCRFTNDCIYYGISLAFSDLGGDRHRDLVLITLPDIVANLLTIYAVERFAYSKHIYYKHTAKLRKFPSNIRLASQSFLFCFINSRMRGVAAAALEDMIQREWKNLFFPIFYTSPAPYLFSQNFNEAN